MSLTTEIPVGEILRRTRVHYKQSIPDVERALRIRASQIEAIESGDLSQLPGRVYAIGFVRSYSEFLGLDGDKMVEVFKAQVGGKTVTPELNFPAAANDSSVPSFGIVFLAIGLIVLVIGGWAGLDYKSRTLVESIPVAPKGMGSKALEAGKQALSGPVSLNSPDANPAVEVQGQPVPTKDTQNPAAAESSKDGIILKIVENSWVEIKDQNGATILSRVLNAGDLYFVPDRPDLNISIGNAGGVQIEIDGKALRPVGKAGEVRRALPLDLEYLKKNFAADSKPAEHSQNSVEKSL